MEINITKQTSYSNTTSYLNRPIKYIVVHYTAGSTSKAGSALNTAVMFSNPSVYASADFIVDDDTIVQFNPDIKNRFCWHCGDNKNMFSMGGKYYGKCTNANSIGIEVCSTNPNWQASDFANSKKWSFTDKVVNNAVELVKYLMQTYNIPIENVIRHYDVTGKFCPGIIGWNEDSGNAKKWEEFKSRLTGVATTANLKKTDDIVYRVRKSANDAKSQIGAYKNLESAKALADKNSGYSVFEKDSGKLVYTPGTGNKKTVTEIAKEVIQGKWGNGEDRKNRLTKAGYDYQAVQAEVNRLMK
ncbi:MAG: N-acetylmuramoyl-L-alanine amidase [Acutalibacteraceae bacterium]|nr:N-acetylmuramoyl-L-alanine amidase [Acutalibacteraceae bacterium]